MSIGNTIAELDNLVKRLSASCQVNADEEWQALLDRLQLLDDQAELLNLPRGKIREETRRLRHHIGAVLGKEEEDGHGRQQHCVWALGAVWGLQSDHCFGPLLGEANAADGDLK